MMDLQFEKLLKYSGDRGRFGKGPKKPRGTGHCYNDDCGSGGRRWCPTLVAHELED